MRKALPILLLLGLALPVIGQSCLPEGISFNTQAQVDQFPELYPGCTTIEGDVYVRPSGVVNLDSLIGLINIGGDLVIDANLASLRGLDSLTSISGSLFIYYTSIQDMSGLNNLQSIHGENVWIADNSQLTSLQGLESISSLPNLYLSNNDALVSLDGLDNLTATTGYLEIKYNENLANLNGLSNLSSIGGNFRLDQSPLITDLLDLSNVSHWGGGVQIFGINGLTSLQGLSNLDTINGDLIVGYSYQIQDISALETVTYVGGNLEIQGIQDLQSIGALHNVTHVGGSLKVDYNYFLQNLSGLENIAYLGGGLSVVTNQQIPNLVGLPVLTHLAGTLDIGNNPALGSLTGLDSLQTVEGDLRVSSNGFNMHDLFPLSRVTTVGGDLFIVANNGLYGLEGLEQLTSVGGSFQVSGPFNDFSGLDNLRSVGGNVDIAQNDNMYSLHGLDSLRTIGGLLAIFGNNILSSLNGLNNLDSVAGRLIISENFQLYGLSELENLRHVGGTIEIKNNNVLSDCAIDIVCGFLNYEPDSITISGNAGACSTSSEVPFFCKRTPVIVSVQIDADGDCLPDTQPLPAPGAVVRLRTPIQYTGLHPVDAFGESRFLYYNNGPFTLDMPQLSPDAWSVCPDSVVITPAIVSDTLRAAFLLAPVAPCPDMLVQLGLPSNFRGCLVTSAVQVKGVNTGAVAAEGVRMAVVMPPVFELLMSDTPVSDQQGDTLFFELGNLAPFASVTINLEVKTNCDTFLLGQTLCWEAFAETDNACPDTPPPASEIRLSANCVGDTIVRFTIQNIGDAATQSPHQYALYQNGSGLSSTSFSLNPQAAFNVDIPADGATYRMEATKFDNGALTATALENCGGLTPGYINAYWLDKGPRDYDLDCRIVNAAYDPNEKSAVPAGIGWPGLLPPNQPLLYTIDFQNTGSDTAYRVELIDQMPFGMDVGTFRPVASSHPCTWDIRGGRLTVLYQPIALPDSNVNEPASRGFFSFEIQQLPDLPDGTVFENNAAIIFDFNPPIITNIVSHVVGRLEVPVAANEPEAHTGVWRVEGNPAHTTAIFRALINIPGVKRFELYDTTGKPVRLAQFQGQDFEFHRDSLPAGLYFFSIVDEQGRRFSGKVVVVD